MKLRIVITAEKNNGEKYEQSYGLEGGGDDMQGFSAIILRLWGEVEKFVTGKTDKVVSFPKYKEN